MKKILAALLVASFGAGLMAQSIVYDYKASIKRIDPTFAVKSVKGSKFVAQSYKVVSDTISGYVVLPYCESCNGAAFDLAETFQTKIYEGEVPAATLKETKEAKGYFVRKGDKLSKANKIYRDTLPTGARKAQSAIPYVLRTPVTGAAALFGAYQQLPSKAPQASIKAANKAWMRLEYYLPSDYVVIDPKVILKSINTSTADVMYLSFLGLTNDGTKLGRPVYHTGFGASSATGTDGITGWCGNVDATTCQIVTSISGTLVGYPHYLGMCNVTPMWDVCYGSVMLPSGEANTNNVREGVICGNWTLKYNKAVTRDYNGASNPEKDVILKKLGVTDTKLIIYTKYDATSDSINYAD